jgi:hypothetical protein
MARRVQRPQHEAVDPTEGPSADPVTGLPLAPRPEYQMPRLPEDATALSDDALMRAWREYIEWADYVATRLADAEVNEENLQSGLATAEAEMLLSEMPDGEALRRREDTMTRVKAQIRTAPSLAHERGRLMQTYAERKMLLTIAERLDRGMNYLSRELTRRTAGQVSVQPRSRRWTT